MNRSRLALVSLLLVLLALAGGADPATTPTEQTTQFELLVNLEVARTLGLTVAPSMLGRATEVVQ